MSLARMPHLHDGTTGKSFLRPFTCFVPDKWGSLLLDSLCMKIPHWASEIVSSYESGAAGCFVLHGNVNDRLLVPERNVSRLGSLQEFVMEALLPRFDVILSYDPGQGLRIERGGEIFSQWPSVKDDMNLPDVPLAAVRVRRNRMKPDATTA